MQANFPGVKFLRNASSLEGEKESRRRLYTASIKLAIKHFHVVVVQGR